MKWGIANFKILKTKGTIRTSICGLTQAKVKWRNNIYLNSLKLSKKIHYKMASFF